MLVFMNDIKRIFRFNITSISNFKYSYLGVKKKCERIFH